MKYPERIYPPVTPVERATGCCPLIQAAFMLDQLKNYFWMELPEGLADEVAQKAEIVFAGNERMRRRFKGRNGREWLAGFMQHWMAAALDKRNRQLARQLPGEYMFGGKPLPPLSLPRQSAQLRPNEKRQKSTGRPLLRHFVHGCELLAAI